MGRKTKANETDVLRAIAVHHEPVVQAGDLLDKLPYDTSDGIRGRLIELEKAGLLQSKKAGSRSRVFWMTDSGRQRLSQSDG